MPEVLAGSQPGLTVSEIQAQMADFAGQPLSDRFKNRITRYINSTILDIQLNDPRMRRTTVHDADFNLIADQDVYNVRDSEGNGGFGWDNCFDILHLSIPSLDDRPLEPLSLSQFRNRSSQTSDIGPAMAWVALDQLRIRISPTPDQAYAGKGDYRQDIPSVSASDDRVDWPRAWDVAILEGVKWREIQRQNPQNAAAWMAQMRVYEDRRDSIIHMDRTSAVIPERAIVTRHLRHRRYLPHDNSTDRR